MATTLGVCSFGSGSIGTEVENRAGRSVVKRRASGQENSHPMPSHSVVVSVLGAGIVGVSAALALQSPGRAVALVDRLPAAAGETSFGNSGIIQTEGVLPYLFP